jgi:predicted DNA-binding transcriptional regulator YafY
MNSTPKKVKAEHAVVQIEFTNLKGKRRTRRICPHYIVYSRVLPWYPDRQHLLYARDLEADKMRHFALASFHSWKDMTREGNDD